VYGCTYVYRARGRWHTADASAKEAPIRRCRCAYAAASTCWLPTPRKAARAGARHPSGLAGSHLRVSEALGSGAGGLRIHFRVRGVQLAAQPRPTLRHSCEVLLRLDLRWETGHLQRTGVGEVGRDGRWRRRGQAAASDSGSLVARAMRHVARTWRCTAGDGCAASGVGHSISWAIGVGEVKAAQRCQSPLARQGGSLLPQHASRESGRALKKGCAREWRGARPAADETAKARGDCCEQPGCGRPRQAAPQMRRRGPLSGIALKRVPSPGFGRQSGGRCSHQTNWGAATDAPSDAAVGTIESRGQRDSRLRPRRPHRHPGSRQRSAFPCVCSKACGMPCSRRWQTRRERPAAARVDSERAKT
jgi:hypothetical protein